MLLSRFQFMLGQGYTGVALRQSDGALVGISTVGSPLMVKVGLLKRPDQTIKDQLASWVYLEEEWAFVRKADGPVAALLETTMALMGVDEINPVISGWARESAMKAMQVAAG